MKFGRLVKVIAVICIAAALVSMLAGCKNNDGDGATAAPTATPGNAVSNVTITDKVDDEIRDKINFEDYENSRAYDLLEVESGTDVKLIAPVIKYQADKMKVQYHIKLAKTGDGSLVLELLGTDFTLPQGIKSCEVEWKSMGEYHTASEKAYRFKNLCILLDGEVYFYEELFYSPMIEGRKQTVEYLNKED